MKQILNKKGLSGGVVNTLIGGVMILFIGIIVSLVVIQTLSTNSLLTAGSVEANATNNARGNISAGIESLNTKIPTAFTIAAVVLILSILLILVLVARRMNTGGGGQL